MNILYPPAYNVTFLGTNPGYLELTWGGSNVAPHALTQRANYTVPVGRRAIITGVFAYVRRQVIGAPVGLVEAQISINYGAAQHSVARLSTINNTLDVAVTLHYPVQIYIPESSNIFIDTVDLSTGGQNYWLVHIAYVTVDK